MPSPSRRIHFARGSLIVTVFLIANAGHALNNTVTAVPHTVSPVQHPFDPDWPDVSLILANKCAACHRPGTQQSDLSTYEAMIAADGDYGRVVVPGKARESTLWQQVVWNAAGHPASDRPETPEMPIKEGEWLTEGQLAAIERWINNGALQYKLPDHCSPRPLMEIDYPSARQCAGCHRRQYDQWSRSMHAYAQQSPIFEAFNLTLIERTSGTIDTFCSRCHTQIGTALGENGSRRNVHRAQISLEGVTCVTCHRQSKGHYKSSGRVHLRPGDLQTTCMYGPFDDAVGSPEIGAHHSRGRPYIKTSQFCGECHDVTTPEGVRLEEAFSEWQNSPAARDRVTCQHCHMGPVQGVPIADHHRPLGRAAAVPGMDPKLLPLRHLTDHTFAGPDYSLLPDTEFPRKLDWMYEVDYRDFDCLTPYQQRTLVDLRRGNRRQLRIADAKRYELLRNAARLRVRAPRCAVAGQRSTVEVDVESIFAGHSLPSGFTAERQVWVSVSVINPAGQAVFTSGDLDSNGDLRDEHSHAVLTGNTPADRLLLNFQNKFLSLSNKGTERSVVLSVNRHLTPLNILRPATGISASFGRPAVFRIAKGSLPPLQTMGQRYPVRFPDCPGDYLLQVRLNFRHLPPTLLDHIGTPHLKHLLEIVVIDSYETVIHVLPK